jgi:hypothetical protein
MLALIFVSHTTTIKTKTFTNDVPRGLTDAHGKPLQLLNLK